MNWNINSVAHVWNSRTWLKTIQSLLLYIIARAPKRLCLRRLDWGVNKFTSPQRGVGLGLSQPVSINGKKVRCEWVNSITDIWHLGLLAMLFHQTTNKHLSFFSSYRFQAVTISPVGRNAKCMPDKEPGKSKRIQRRSHRGETFVKRHCHITRTEPSVQIGFSLR